MTLSLETLRLLLHDALRFRAAIVGMFIFVSLAALAVGLVWPQYYSSSTTIYVQESNIIQPLMSGTAVPTEVRDRAGIAREVITSQKVLDKLVDGGSWPKEELSGVRRVILMRQLTRRIVVTNQGKNLIRITYADTNAERAQQATNRLAELFITESDFTKVRESKSAFQFIDKQVKIYQEKLTEAENNLQAFMSAHPDVRLDSQANVRERLDALRRKIEETRLAIKEAQTRKAALDKQLYGEADLTASLSREAQYRDRLVQLQKKLDGLRLSYRDTYPDIVSLKRQIAELTETITAEEQRRGDRRIVLQAWNNRDSGNGTDVDVGASVNPVYEALLKAAMEAKTNIETLRTRLAETEALLAKDTRDAPAVDELGSRLADLNKTYEFYRNTVADLIQRREHAKLSMELEQGQHGLTFRVQEPATVPLKTSRLSLLHFALGGIAFGIAVPLGLLYTKLNLDPRILLPSSISEGFGLPTLAVVPYLANPSERRRFVINGILLVLGLLLYLAGYAATVGLRLKGMI
jgi:protein tyrosine kinase modulator